MFAEYNINGYRMRIEFDKRGWLLIKLRRKFLWVFPYWRTVTFAKSVTGIKRTYLVFEGEIKEKMKPLRKRAKQ